MLTVGLKWGVSLGFLDFFYHHYVATVRCETEYFYLTPQPTRKFFGYNPTHSEIVLISGFSAQPNPFGDFPCSQADSVAEPPLGRSHHDVLYRVSLATSAPFFAIEDIVLDNEPIIPADGEIWRPKFHRSDGKRLMTNEGLLHDPEACDAVLGGLLHPQNIKEFTDLDDRDTALQ
ncbi:hypothetical protein Pyn_14235 [Prunus yedoensis var. nudiflora]|uniref:Uncharacterized protein n=1 Tax=Prunus yedoensis var. nudiflora TaxID=2094558 RepID=A0A314YPN0_PRUYE|nr:hypothetical protein Pyn_14235 [Prunus yedoensis var. nudiflora]